MNSFRYLDTHAEDVDTGALDEHLSLERECIEKAGISGDAPAESLTLEELQVAQQCGIASRTGVSRAGKEFFSCHKTSKTRAVPMKKVFRVNKRILVGCIQS